MKGSDGDDDAGGKTKRETEFLETVNNTSAEAKMAADWVEDCIESGSTLTVPTPNFGEQPMLAMQFLNVQKKIVVLPTARGRHFESYATADQGPSTPSAERPCN